MDLKTYFSCCRERICSDSILASVCIFSSSSLSLITGCTSSVSLTCSRNLPILFIVRFCCIFFSIPHLVHNTHLNIWVVRVPFLVYSFRSSYLHVPLTVYQLRMLLPCQVSKCRQENVGFSSAALQ